jgi:hypothetical protein
MHLAFRGRLARSGTWSFGRVFANRTLGSKMSHRKEPETMKKRGPKPMFGVAPAERQARRRAKLKALRPKKRKQKPSPQVEFPEGMVVATADDIAKAFGLVLPVDVEGYKRQLVEQGIDPADMEDDDEEDEE